MEDKKDEFINEEDKFVDDIVHKRASEELYEYLSRHDVNLFDLQQKHPEVEEKHIEWAANFYFGKQEENSINKKIEEANREKKYGLRKASFYEPKDTEYLIDGWLPKGKITLISADGGTGKTTIMGELITGFTTGRKTILDAYIPFDFKRQPMIVMYFNPEDTVGELLKVDWRHADPERIITLDAEDKNFKKIIIGSEFLTNAIAEYKPDVCIFDPLQSFLDPSVNMNARNQMRHAIQPLNYLGHKYGVTFIILAHTNKRGNVSGRNRVSDSSDIWDFCRSVIMMGKVDESIRYISHEKCNGRNQQLKPTVLYSLQNGIVTFEGITNKRDDDFQKNKQYQSNAPAREQAVDVIIEFLKGKEAFTAEVREINEYCKKQNISDKAITKAKSFMKNNNQIISFQKNIDGKPHHYITLLQVEE